MSQWVGVSRPDYVWTGPGREASPGIGAPPYVRHRPERTLLYQLVEEYYPAFKAHLAA